LHAPVDVLINSEEEMRKKRKLPGHVVQYALEEGILL
jgi:ribosome-associated protein YbcJ (S4-like RNA binding protein)